MRIYKCEECGKIIEGKNDLLEHYLVKHGIHLIDSDSLLDHMLYDVGG